MKSYLNGFTLFVFVYINIGIGSVNARHDSNDLILTQIEKRAMDEFKPLVWNRLKEPFMKSEFYLIRWLRKANLDVNHAKKLLIDTIAWRDRNNMTAILSEDWFDLEQDYQMLFEGHDKMGRPLLFLNLGDWNLRDAVIHGKIKRLQRYLNYGTEKSTKRIFEAQQKGQQVTRLVVLADNDGLNILQHGCPRCTSFFAQWAIDRENHYPDFTEETVLINVPAVGAFILNAVLAVSSLQDQIKSFDSNRSNWMKYLDERVNRDQRPPRYGGTRNS